MPSAIRGLHPREPDRIPDELPEEPVASVCRIAAAVSRMTEYLLGEVAAWSAALMAGLVAVPQAARLRDVGAAGVSLGSWPALLGGDRRMAGLRSRHTAAPADCVQPRS